MFIIRFRKYQFNVDRIVGFIRLTLKAVRGAETFGDRWFKRFLLHVETIEKKKSRRDDAIEKLRLLANNGGMNLTNDSHASPSVSQPQTDRTSVL